MKRIAEEWKRIEGFPNHEISNFGRCRNMKTGRMLTCTRHRKANPEHCLYTYEAQYDHKNISRTAGKLVAQAFVPNPNGYACIRYKDGNPANFNYLNIEWVGTALREADRRGLSKTFQSREDQIHAYKKYIGEASRQVEYLEEGRIAELVYEMYLPAIKKFAYCRFHNSPEDLREDFISFATDTILDRMERGMVYLKMESAFGYLKKQFWRDHKKTAEYNDAIMYKNESI
jgi:hypothetical protein